MSWRNERFLYRNTCGLCNKPIISIYSSQSPYIVYCHTCFRNDKWDPLSYGIEYDFKRPFFEQFKELQLKVPRLYAMVTECYNSEYVNGAAWNKNCYLIFASDHDEDCAYSHSIFYCRDVFDCLGARHCEFSAGLIDCEKLSNSFYSQDCIDSYNLLFCKNCLNCHDCIGSVNLHNRSFCIFNEQYTKEDYQKLLLEMKISTSSGFNNIFKKAQKFYLEFPVKYYHGKNNLNSSGDYLIHAKNSTLVFDGEDVENSKYLYIVNKVKDSYDGYSIVENAELNLEVISHNSSFSKFCFCYWSGNYGTYSDTCENCSNVFGCIGLRNKNYCILNKQYTKEEYEKLLHQITEQMKNTPYVDSKGRKYGFGEYFPMDMSPFAYNETVAQEFFPLIKEIAKDKGYRWVNKEEKNYQIEIKNENIPDDISDVSQDIIGKIIECEHKGECGHQCTEAYKITKEEFLFYRRMNLPIPKICSNCRHYERLAKRNPLKLWTRECECDKEGHFHGDKKCLEKFQTSYSSEKSEIIYCEKCYQQEIY